VRPRPFDTIKTGKGSLYGEVIGMDSDKVELRQSSNALVKQIAVNEIMPNTPYSISKDDAAVRRSL